MATVTGGVANQQLTTLRPGHHASLARIATDGLDAAEVLENQAIAEMDASAQRVFRAARNAFPERNDPFVVFAEAFVGSAVASTRASRLLNRAAEQRLRQVITDATPVQPPPERVASGRPQLDGKGSPLEEKGIRKSLYAPFGQPNWRVVVVAALVIAIVGGAGYLIGSQRASRDDDGPQQVMLPFRSESSFPGVSVSRQPELDASSTALLALTQPEREVAIRYARLGTQRFRQAFLTVAELAAKNAAEPQFVRQYAGCLTAGPSGPWLDRKLLRTCLVEVPQTAEEPDTTLKHYYEGQAEQARPNLPAPTSRPTYGQVRK